MRVTKIAMVMLLIPMMMVGMISRPTRADEIDLGRPFRIRVTAFAHSVGYVESAEAMAVDGKTFQGRRALWGGELLQASVKTGATAQLESIGAVELGKSSMARVAAAVSESNEGTHRGLLSASLIRGGIKVNLNPDAGAYIETCGYRLTSSDGAVFSVTVRGLEPEITASSGWVQVESQTVKRTYIVRPVGMGASTSVRARSSRQIQVQVTDEHDKPIPDIPVLFALGAGGPGSLGSGAAAGSAFTATTNAQGIATAPFSAGNTLGTNSITATVEGTDSSWTGEIAVVKSIGFWTTQNKILVGAGVAVAAGVAAGVAATRGNNDQEQHRVQITPTSTGVRP